MDSKLFYGIISAMCALQLMYSCPLDEYERLYAQDKPSIGLYFGRLHLMGRIFTSDLQFIREQISDHPNSTMSDLETAWKKISKNKTDDNIRPVDLLLRDLEKLQNGVTDYQKKVALLKEKTSGADVNTPVKELLEAMLKE
ncbi:uncharacterized protein LOC141532867 [Cotesia typhae]|uniref:uncharacterized protein LOC141532867 n=1 Tax=Cotesia typhae TaxID=2053667 RepID=UPI003D685D02